MAKVALTYRNEQGIVCTEVVDTEAPRYKELTEDIFLSDQVFLSSKRLDDSAKPGITSRMRTLRYADSNRSNYREKDLEYRIEKQNNGTEVARFVNFEPFTILGYSIDVAPTQSGDRLSVNVGNGGQIIPEDAKEMKALRYVIRILQVFNNNFVGEDDSNDDTLADLKNQPANDESSKETTSKQEDKQEDLKDDQKSNQNKTEHSKDNSHKQFEHYKHGKHNRF